MSEHETEMRAMEEVSGRRGAWRPVLVVSGLLLFIGGGMHPSAPEGLSFRDNLAAMMEDDAWVPGHALMAVSSALLVVGLMMIRRRNSWPEAAKVLPVAVAAAAFNTFELILHTASVVDKEELAAGESPLIAMAHLTAAVIGYPLFGIAIAVLAWKLLRSWSAPLRAVSIVGGIANALSAPIAIVSQKNDFDFCFLSLASRSRCGCS